MKNTFCNILICFLSTICLIGCSAKINQIKSGTKDISVSYFNQEINYTALDTSNLNYAKPPVGFAGLQNEDLIYAEIRNEKMMDDTRKNQIINTIPAGVGFDSLVITEGPVTDPLMIAGVACIGVGILGSTFIPFSSVLVLVGIGLIIASLIRIKNHPEKYKGKGMGIAALVVVGALLLLSIVVILAFLGLFG